MPSTFAPSLNAPRARYDTVNDMNDDGPVHATDDLETLEDASSENDILTSDTLVTFLCLFGVLLAVVLRQWTL